MTAQDIKNELERIVPKGNYARIQPAIGIYLDGNVYEELDVFFRIGTHETQIVHPTTVAEALSFLEIVFQKKKTKIEVEL